MLRLLRSNFQCQIKVFSFDPEFTSETHKIESINHSIVRSPIKMLKAISSCDLFILGGGGLLQDESSLLNTPFWISKLLLAILFRKKTMIYANGIGPIRSMISRLLIRFVSNKAGAITVRDSNSRELLKSMGIKREIYTTTDPAFSLDTHTSQISPIEQRIKSGKKFVTISLRHWFDSHPLIPVKYSIRYNLASRANKTRLKHFIIELAKVVDWINNDLNMDVVFVPMCPSRDNKISEYILRKVKDKSRNLCLNSYYSPREVIEIIRLSEFVIGMRLHSLIYSSIIRKPFVALIYTLKIQSFLDDIGIPNIGIDIKNITSEDIMRSVRYVRSNYENISDRLQFFATMSRKRDIENIHILNRAISNGTHKHSAQLL